MSRRPQSLRQIRILILEILQRIPAVKILISAPGRRLDLAKTISFLDGHYGKEMNNRPCINEKGPTVIVACRVMMPELERARAQDGCVEIHYLDQGLHRTPDKMAGLIRAQVDEAAQYAERIVLGYGLCSNGIVGVKARPQGLLIPSCHDCIAFFFGSPEAYGKAFEETPGTYYLTPGWVSERRDPLGIVEDDYTVRVGREMGVWAMEEELRHYTHIALINTGIGDLGSLRERAMENARFFRKIRGDQREFDIFQEDDSWSL